VYGCGYPIQESAVDTLADRVVFERHLGAQAVLVAERQQCRAGRRVDSVAFQVGQAVARCPTCDVPFHLGCWLQLDTCPGCAHPTRAFIDRAFGAGQAD
jgi:hypothetical protein